MKRCAVLTSASALTCLAGCWACGDGGAGHSRVYGDAAGAEVIVVQLDASASGTGGRGGGGEDGGVRSFLNGLNLTRNNPSWNGRDLAVLTSMTGADAVRVPLSEDGFIAAGAELKALSEHGVSSIIGLLGSVAPEHSTAPAGAAPVQLQRYIPRNLELPFLDSAGRVPVDNYWAAYVARVVLEYRDRIHIWQVWEQPDGDATAADAARWATEPPKASELPSLHGSVFDYVRMARIAWTIVHGLDPAAIVIAGGIATPSFLSAVARYTDDPAGGGVSPSFPRKGAAYFDGVGFVFWPRDAAAGSSGAADGFIRHFSDLQAALSAAGGGASTSWFSTATGASHIVIPGAPSGAVFARSYVVKAMTRARAHGIAGVFWHQLGDTAVDGASTDAMDFTGLFFDLQDLADTSLARRTDTAEAYRSVALALAGTVPDANATAALALPADACGHAFRDVDGQRVAVLWACGDESAAFVYSLPASSPVSVRRWDYVVTMLVDSAAPTEGFVQLPLTSSPIVVTGG